MNIYPWQKSTWVEVFSNKLKMPHAYIFYGAQGTEIHKFVDELIKSVLCSSPSYENCACRKCQDCLWSETNHPDLKVVESALDRGEKVSTDTLNVANAREVKNFLELTPHQENGKKIVVIYGAERLTIAASNALLKTIEEQLYKIILPEDNVDVEKTKLNSSKKEAKEVKEAKKGKKE